MTARSSVQAPTAGRRTRRCSTRSGSPTTSSGSRARSRASSTCTGTAASSSSRATTPASTRAGSSSPTTNTDTYNAPGTMRPFFRASCAAAGTSAISFGRSSEPSLEEERQEYLYRALSMGFGLEGIASGPTTTQLGDRAMDWLLDKLSVELESSTAEPGKRTTIGVDASSSVGASIVRYRWDFGDGSPYETTTVPSADHKYQHRGMYEVRIEATDSLGHRTVAHGVVPVKPK